MNKKIIVQYLAVCIFFMSSFTHAVNDPRLTRDVVIDIDATLTACCAQIDINFEGTFTVIADLSDFFELLSGVCSPQLIGQAEVGTTGFVISTSGVYKLSENIVFNPAGSAAAITINADNVMLDLQCFNITQGNSTAAVDGISIGANHTSIMINSGRIKNFSRDGIRVASGSSNLAYSDITIQNCLYGIFCLGTDVAPIEIIRAVGLDLISNSTGVSLTFVNRAFISESSWFNHAYAGVELISSFSNSITNCSIEKTGSVTGSAAGISMIQGGDNRVESCSIDGVSTNDTFSGNSAVGIVLGATENDDLILNNQISNCTTTSNAQPFGIEMQYTFTALVPITRVSIGTGTTVTLWSPNGRYVAVVAQNTNAVNVLEFSEGSLKTIRTLSLTNPTSLRWSPDSSYLAVNSNGSGLQIYNVNQGILTLAASAASSPTSTSWSPDGKYVAVGGTGVSTFVVYRFTGTSLDLAATVSTGLGSTINQIIWSPTDPFIAVSFSGGPASTFLYQFTGNALQFIASVSSTITKSIINWSPDGRFLAVVGTTNVSVYLVSSTGFQIVASVAVASPTDLFWSPDGEYLAVINSSPSQQLIIYKFTGSSLLSLFSQSFTSLNTDQGLGWSALGDVLVFGGGITTSDVTVDAALQFPSGTLIKNNKVSQVRGPALAANQLGVSTGNGISASSAHNLIQYNTGFDNDLNFVFVNNVFSQSISNVNPVPNRLSNLSF